MAGGGGGSQQENGQGGEKFHYVGQFFVILSLKNKCSTAATLVASEFSYLWEIGFARQAKESGKDPETYSTPAAGHEIMIPEIASGIGNHVIE